jgi:hypothetical protein
MTGIYHRKRSRITRFGTCPVCDLPKKLVADHCHSTNLTREPICRTCNMLLGLAHDSPTLLRTAAAYLEHHTQLHAQYQSRTSGHTQDR